MYTHCFDKQHLLWFIGISIYTTKVGCIMKKKKYTPNYPKLYGQIFTYYRYMMDPGYENLLSARLRLYATLETVRLMKREGLISADSCHRIADDIAHIARTGWTKLVLPSSSNGQ